MPPRGPRSKDPKKPLVEQVDGRWGWKHFQVERPGREKVARWYADDRTWLGTVCGKVARNLELFEFDCRATYDAFLRVGRRLGIGGLIDRIEAGYCEDTPGGGVHWLIRCEVIAGNTPLARRHKAPDEFDDRDREAIEKAKAEGKEHRPVMVLIETRGEGGYAVIAPTVGLHANGKGYVLRSGGAATIPTITPDERQALWALARTFDKLPPKGAERARADDAAQQARTAGGGWELRPGDDFNARASWDDVLVGWAKDHTEGEVTYWRRVGKDHGWSATTGFGGADLLFVFSTATVLDAQTWYRKFHAYAALHHSGDFKAAALALHARGYGRKTQQKGDRGGHDYEIYKVVAGRLCRVVATRDGKPVPAPMCNFEATIRGEIVRDDGVEQSRRLTVAGTLANGQALPPIEVSTEEFARGDWPLTHWGPRAVVHAGQGNKDHLRAALQLRSGQVPCRTMRAFTGWCKIGGAMAYLHAGGAIGPDGTVADVSIDLPDALAGFRLPDPPEGAALIESIRASLELARGLAPDHVILPLRATTCRAVLPGSDFSTHVTGRTGTFKTELAALEQQHFGAGMDARHLPANWSSTGNALEALAFAAKDALLVVDDFCPAGNVAEMGRYQREADRLLRGQGNRSGRQRLRPDGTPRPAKPPRGAILTTGEDVPKGHSLRARLLVVEVEQGDVDPTRLAECQRAAAEGRYAAALAGFVRWIAGRYEQVVSDLAAEARRLRDEITAELAAGHHRRTPALVADLLAGFGLFLRFAREAGAITDRERDKLARRCRAALLDVGDRQAAEHEAADPCDRFLALLMSVLSSGRAHLASSAGMHPTGLETACGWRPEVGPDSGWVAQGKRIGWIEGPDLFLDPDAAHAEVQRLATEQADPLPVTGRTLHKRLRERGLLTTVDQERQRLTVRRVLDGVRRSVLHLCAARVIHAGETGPTGPSDPDREKTAGNGPVSWDGPAPPTENRPTETGPFPAGYEAVGPDGTIGPVPGTHNARPADGRERGRQ